MHFCRSSNGFKILTFQLFYLQKVGQGHGIQFSQLRYSMANVKIYKRNLFTFFIFAKVRSAVTTVTNEQTHTETDKAMAIGKIADLPKNYKRIC